MEIKKNQIKRSYGEFKIKDWEFDEAKEDKEVIKSLHIYRWKDGILSFQLDSKPLFRIKEDDLIKGIKKLPKVN